MLAIALFIGPFLCLVGLVSIAFGFIRTWSEYRTLLQSTGWIIGPIGAAVALHYSGQRTAQMIKQVDTQRRVDQDEVHHFDLDGDMPSYVDMPIWYTHNISNGGDEELVTVFWINEHFDPEDADTYFLTV